MIKRNEKQTHPDLEGLRDLDLDLDLDLERERERERDRETERLLLRTLALERTD